MNLRQGTLLKHGEYRIERELGHGGFGVTYSAVQVGLNRRVAIKEFFMSEYCNRDAETSHVTVPSEGSKELVAKFRNKFIKEAQNIAGLKHPNIISIYDVFEDNGTAYYVMEYLDHGSLADVVKRQGRLSEADALSYTRQIADALRYIHARNMNHLDVKPANILIDENNAAVLIDFGLSKRYDDEGNQTSTTPVGISHGYAPLEQYKKGGVGTFSPATDIYSLGATLYKLITGTTPPDADVISDDGLPALPHGISSSTANAIERAMQPGRKKRPQTIEEFLALLDASSSDIPVTVEDEATQLDESLRASLVTPSASQSSARPSINRGTVGGVSSHPEGKHQQVGGGPKRSAEQTSFSFKKLLWPLLACVVAVVAFFGVRAYSEHRAEVARLAEEARLAAIEQRRIDSIAKAKEINGHEWVDLGLSVKWATCNVGASSPGEYGNYYARGETEEKSNYTPLTYKYYLGDLNRDGWYYDTNEYQNIGSNISGTSYDVAHVKWGGSWRLPTMAEFEELEEKCSWVWTTQDGHNGYKVTGKNGKSIFLPAAGYRDGTRVVGRGSHGDYSSGSQYLGYGYVHCFHSGSHLFGSGMTSPYLGRTVRPVSER